MPHALISLVSEQTLPNILPALALKPARSTLLHTPQTRRQCDWISTALRTAGHIIEIELSPLSDHPDHPTTGQAVRQVITAHRTLGLTPVVDFTGGTKRMSIGAFAATNAEKAPDLYFDTTARQIHPGTTLALPAPLDSSATAFRLIAAQLSVSILTSAHGINHFIPGRDPAAWLPLSRLLAADPKLEQATPAFATTTLYERNRRPGVRVSSHLRRPPRPLAPPPRRHRVCHRQREILPRLRLHPRLESAGVSGGPLTHLPILHLLGTHTLRPNP